MILIQDILVSRAVLDEHFVCHLDKCKGVCCVGGDFGAPVDDAEIPILEEVFGKIRGFMSESGIAAIEAHGIFQMFDKPAFKGITLREDGACAFVRIDESGMAHCTIEEAWKAGVTDFRKPISCHLYPVRIKSSKRTKFEAVNYDEWELCRPACKLGKSLKVPVYQFVREALIRKYGEAFYAELDEVARELNGDHPAVQKPSDP